MMQSSRTGIQTGHLPIAATMVRANAARAITRKTVSMDEEYLRFAEASERHSIFTEDSFVHPRTWWKNGMRHAADTSVRPQVGHAGMFFVIAPCHEMDYLHVALKRDVGPVTCLLRLMKTTEPR